MFDVEIRNVYEFNREKELREEVMSSRDMFNGMRPTLFAERENLMGKLFESVRTRI